MVNHTCVKERRRLLTMSGLLQLKHLSVLKLPSWGKETLQLNKLKTNNKEYIQDY